MVVYLRTRNRQLFRINPYADPPSVIGSFRMPRIDLAIIVYGLFEIPISDGCEKPPQKVYLFPTYQFQQEWNGHKHEEKT